MSENEESENVTVSVTETEEEKVKHPFDPFFKALSIYCIRFPCHVQLLREENIPGLTISSRNHEEELLKQLEEHFEKQNESNNDETSTSDTSAAITKMLATDEAKETENEREIRLGKMTPFGTTLSKNISSR